MLLRTSLLLLALLSYASPALAGNWGENWGEMVWNSIAAVPSMGKLGGLVLVLGLGGIAARFIQRGRAVASLLVIGLVVPMLAPAANAQTVSVPNTLTNGSLAEADEVNANFEAVRSGVNMALTSADVTELTQFTNGTTADADEVNANFTAVVDGVNTALANRATDCAGAGGTWDAGTSTCTPAPNYNCFVGGFCSELAIRYPPAANGYTNVYEGDTLADGDANWACIYIYQPHLWEAGVSALQLHLLPHPDIIYNIDLESFVPLCESN
ncbi:MAG: hypothetical protein ACI8W3_001141 [Myxococcota bacterium]|jgi:hypothetical protein